MPDEEFGRVSYTQFEFLYAQARGKKTYVLFAGPGCRKDTPAEELDPGNHDELRDLQSAYRASLRSGGHLWHHPADDTALENSVLKLRDDSEQLRREFKDWQKSLTRSQSRTSRNLLLLAALILLLGIGGYLAWQSTQKRFDAIPEQVKPRPLDKSRLREHLTAASEKALAADLAEADAIQGDWEKRQKLTDAANEAHKERISRVSQLAEDFVSIETGKNRSTTLSEMLRIFDDEGIDSALAYLSSQTGRLIDQAKTNKDLQPLLTGAQLALANGQPEKAEALFLQLLAPGLPDWPQARHEYIVYLIWTKGTRQQTYGTLAGVLATYREAERQSRLLTLQDPENKEWQRDLSASHERLGDIAKAQGDLPAAKAAYTASLEIRKTLTARDPENTQWQRDLAVSHNKLGDIAVAQGDLPAAKAAYTASMEIRKTLAARGPENTEWQRDLSVCHEKFGDIAKAQGDLPAAKAAYTASLEISKTLTARDPENTEWQFDLGISYERLGNIAKAQGDLPAAKAAYTARHEIIKTLAARDPENTQWQRDLSVSHYKLATVAKREGNAVEARELYKQSHDVLAALAADGKHVSPQDMKALEFLKEDAGLE